MTSKVMPTQKFIKNYIRNCNTQEVAVRGSIIIPLCMWCVWREGIHTVTEKVKFSEENDGDYVK